MLVLPPPKVTEKELEELLSNNSPVRDNPFNEDDMEVEDEEPKVELQ